jgi:hypothetical protein
LFELAVTLEWVRDHYDANKNRYIESDEVDNASADYPAKITMEQLFAVIDASANRTLLPAYTTTSQAKGEILNTSYPATVEHGSDIDIGFRVKNGGGSSGTFKVALYKGTARVVQTSPWVQPAGTTSGTFSLGTSAPTYGTNVSYVLKCIRVT